MKEPHAILSQNRPQNVCMEIKHASGSKQGLSGATQTLMEEPPLRHPGGCLSKAPGIPPAKESSLPHRPSTVYPGASRGMINPLLGGSFNM